MLKYNVVIFSKFYVFKQEAKIKLEPKLFYKSDA